MSAVLDLHPTPGHPAAVAAAVYEVVDTVEVAALAPSEYAEAVTEWQRAIRRMEAVQLQLVAAAERSTVADDAGCASTGAWLSRQTRSGIAAASRSVQLANDLDDHLPATSEALSDGALSTEHAAVIAHAMSRLPAGLSAEKSSTIEQSLVKKAHRVDPQQLRRLARRALAAVEPDQETVDTEEDQQVRDEEQAARAKTRLTLHDNGDGTLSGHFTVPVLAGSILQKILDAMTAPRRARSREAQDHDWAHERGLAFTQLLERLPTDHLHGKSAATIVVTLDLDTLRGQLKAAGLDTGDLVSASEARRLACSAGLVPAVLGGQSQPLNLGRRKRLFTDTQRIALGLHHTTCAADGCERPYAWCELHHRQPWSTGGPTDLANAVPLCGFHHRRIHDPRHRHRTRADGSIVFHQRT